MNKLLLGVNIDHIATLRNARGTKYPDPVQAGFIAEQAGADNITIHLREDRRHITDRDIYILCQTLNTRMNLEMAITEEMLNIACKIKPYSCCLVPEQRQEITTENGLNVIEQRTKIHDACKRLKDSNIQISLFVNANVDQIRAAADIGAACIEIHTGYYSDAKNNIQRNKELDSITKAAKFADSIGLQVHAGHGLTYYNVQAIANIPEIQTLNIGHAIISRAVINGLKAAIEEMKHIIFTARLKSGYAT